MAFPWSETLENLALELWKQGKSGAEIQRELMARTSETVSRSAVIAKLYRIGAPKRPNWTNADPAAIARRSRIAAQKLAQKRKEAKAAQKVAACVVTQPRLTRPAPSQAPVTKKIPLTETSAEHCRYMEGTDGTCCGHERAPNSPYCQYHTELTRQKGTATSKADKRILGFEPIGDIAERAVAKLMAGC